MQIHSQIQIHYQNCYLIRFRIPCYPKSTLLTLALLPPPHCPSPYQHYLSSCHSSCQRNGIFFLPSCCKMKRSRTQGKDSSKSRTAFFLFSLIYLHQNDEHSSYPTQQFWPRREGRSLWRSSAPCSMFSRQMRRRPRCSGPPYSLFSLARRKSRRKCLPGSELYLGVKAETRQ